jgi:integrase
MSSIEKRETAGGQTRYYVRWRDPAGAARSKSFPRAKDARAYLTRVDSQILGGEYVDPTLGKVTFRQYAEDWRQRQAWRPATDELARRHLTRHVYPVIGDLPLVVIRPSHLQAAVRTWLATLEPSTVGVILGRVKAILNAATNDRMIGSNPARTVRLKRAGHAEISPLHPDQVTALLDTIDDRYRALTLVMAGNGLRISEALGLTVDRVDFLRRQLRVDRQLAGTVAARVTFEPPKAPASVRTIPMPQVVVDALARHVQQYGIGPHGLLFTSASGNPLTRGTASNIFRTAAKRSGVDASPHDLRHFAASALIRSGASVKAVQRFLGHSDPTTTLRVYAHLWHDDDEVMRGALDAVLQPTVYAPCTGVAGNPV